MTKEFYSDNIGTLFNGDSMEVLKSLESNSVDCVVTSPPYFGLRDYGTAKWEGGEPLYYCNDCNITLPISKLERGCPKCGETMIPIECNHQYAKGGRNPETAGKQLTNSGTLFSQYEHVCKKCGAKRVDNQIGLEETPELYVERMVELLRECKRVLKDNGTLWLNIGDSYYTKPAGNKTWNRNVGANKNYENGHIHQVIERKLDNLKQKDLIGIPWMLAFAMRADGWYLRNDIIWAKPNPMPESVTDRLTKSHEHIFLFTKSRNYFFDNLSIAEPCVTNENRPFGAVREREFGYDSKHLKARKALYNDDGIRGYVTKDGDNGLSEQRHGQRISVKLNANGIPFRNKRDVWFISPKPYKGSHFATFPKDLIEPCIKAGCPENGIVLDPFFGAGTTGVVAESLNRMWIGIELNEEYCKMAVERILKERNNNGN